ncbi:hypothetical protein [uncultured Clostridium sp.]|uniref:hypothetical protein n=1 Tax=uncultured Clostridium sp. TaxID=59620 RepID=UPI0025FB8530|nr:hypothetical protein [uncultured Clostridium sp.]
MDERIKAGTKVMIKIKDFDRPIYRLVENIREYDGLVFIVDFFDGYDVSFIDDKGKRCWIDADDVEITEARISYEMPEMIFKKSEKEKMPIIEGELNMEKKIVVGSHIKVNIKDTEDYLYEEIGNISDLNGVVLKVNYIGDGLVAIDDGEGERWFLKQTDVELTEEKLSVDIPVIIYNDDEWDNDDNHRYFEIVSDYKNKIDNSFIPKRADNGSAGYDFRASEDIIVPSLLKNFLGCNSFVLNTDVMTIEQVEKFNKENKLKATMIPTGIKAKMPADEVLKLYPRSSIGCKSLLMMPNNVGIIDSSYYNNPGNEGHIYIPFINLSPVNILIKKGDRVAQGIFVGYFATSDDAPVKDGRDGGFGSSGR